MIRDVLWVGAIIMMVLGVLLLVTTFFDNMNPWSGWDGQGPLRARWGLGAFIIGFWIVTLLLVSA